MEVYRVAFISMGFRYVQVRKRYCLRRVLSKNDHFAKTGSGRT